MYEIIKCMEHLNVNYVLSYCKTKLVIYSRETLDHVQTLRDFMSDIHAVATSRKGVFVVFCEREYIAYKCDTYDRCLNGACNQAIVDAFFSRDDRYLIGCSSKSLHIWEAQYDRVPGEVEQWTLKSLDEIFTVEMDSEVANVKFSPDVRYFSTLQQTILTVWDFEAVKEQQEGDLSAVPRLPLQHAHPIISHKFRETLRHSPSLLATPNTIATLTTADTLTIWQEVLTSRSFCKLHTLHLNRTLSFCFIFLNTPIHLQNRPYIQPDHLGQQDLEPSSLDYILVHEEDQMRIYRIDYLRNYSLQDSVEVVKSSKSNGLLRSVRKIILADQQVRDTERVEVIGFDRLWNIVKVVINLTENSIQSYLCDKYSWQQIKCYSVGRKRIYLLNNWGYLCRIERYQGILPFELMPQKQTTLWKIEGNYNQIAHQEDEIDSVILNGDNVLLIQVAEFEITCNFTQLEGITRIITDPKGIIIFKKDSLQQIAFKNKEINILEQIPISKELIYEQNHFFSIMNKSVIVYNEHMKSILVINKTINLRYAGILKGSPEVYYLIGMQNEIDFHNAKGHFLTRFNLTQFLIRVDKSLYDVAKIAVQIVPQHDYIFLLKIDNFVIALNLVFIDQQFRVQAIKHLDNNREIIFFKRLAKSESPFQFDKGVLIGKTRVKELNLMASSSTWLPCTIFSKAIQGRYSIQVYDADFLQELLLLGKKPLVLFLFRQIALRLKNHGALGQMSIPYKDLSTLYEYQNSDMIEWGQVSGEVPKISQELRDAIEIDQISTLMDPISELKLHRLRMLLEHLKYVEDNGRSLDPFAEIYIFNVHLFRSQPQNKKRSLTSREVAWAMHSLQKETLWTECIQEKSWSLVKRYSAVLWMDINVLKQLLEDIALATFRQTKDPFQSLLYYLILNKKAVITMLFKGAVSQGDQHKNTYQFLCNDFTLDRWKSASSKNAYALVQRKRYQDAAAFFLMGGHLKDAVNVIALYMEDIQLALLTCKVFEPQGGPITEQLVQDHFIKAGEQLSDIWLLHIGYVLLNRYVDATNILMILKEQDQSLQYDQQGRCICLSWPSTFTPMTTGYHPSAILLLEMLKGTLPVKREIQNSIDQQRMQNQPAEDDIFASFCDEPVVKTQVSQEVVQIKKIEQNEHILIKQAIEYYFFINQPQLGLVLAVDQESEFKDPLLNIQLDMYLSEALADDEHFIQYAPLKDKVKQLEQFVNIPLIHLIESKVQLLQSPCRTLILSQSNSKVEQFISYCTDLQQIFSRLCFGNVLITRPQEYYSVLIQGLYEMDIGLKYLQFDSHKLCEVKLFTLLVTFILAIQFKLWDKALESMRKWETFCNAVFLNKNLEWNYENLRDDLLSVLKQHIQQLPQYRKKTNKAHRNDDLFHEAFPEDKYNQQNEIPQEEQKINPELILNLLLQAKSIEQLLRRSPTPDLSQKVNLNQLTFKNLFSMAQSYAVNRRHVAEGLLVAIKDFSMEMAILWDLKVILKENSTRQSLYFKDIELENVTVIARQAQLDLYIDDLIIKRSRHCFKYPVSSYEEINTIRYRNQLFSQGVEIIRLKSEVIKSFCLSMTDATRGAVLTSKTLRPMDVKSSLLNKNRSLDGMDLIGESEDGQARIEGRPQIIKLINSVLDVKENMLRPRANFADEFKNYSDRDYQDRLLNTQNRTDEDMQCVVSHPHLPLFLNSQKGIVSIMSFMSLKPLSEFTSNQKEYIDIIKFNTRGELFLGHDANNSCYIWKLHRNSKSNAPLLTLNRKVSDITFVNEGSVFASIYNSSTRPHYGLYDLLLPPQKNMVMQESFNGTDILFSAPTNSVLIANQKKGTVNFLDIRKNQIYQTLEFPFQEIKLLKLNHFQDKLFCALKDGSLKLVRCQDMSILHDMKPFKLDHKQKQPQIVALAQTEDAMYAASSKGTISLVYMNA